MPVTATTSSIQLKSGGQPRLAVGSWRADPAHSQASFTARAAGRDVQGRLPLTGEVRITEPIEDSTAWLAARTSAVSTGSPVLDRLLAGPGFLDARAFPEISFQSESLVWVPAGWRAVGRLRVKNAEHELACQLSLHPAGLHRGGLHSAGLHSAGLQPGGPRIVIAGSWAIDSRWVTSEWIPGLGRRIVMTCSCLLELGM
jgi:polyisoprenoid-binding protein YceI